MHAGSKGVLAGQVGLNNNTTKQHKTGNSQKIGGCRKRAVRGVRGAKEAELKRGHQNTQNTRKTQKGRGRGVRDGIAAE